MNFADLQDPSATQEEKLVASLGILAGAAETLAGLMPPATMLTPQGAAIKAMLTGVAIAASAAQLVVNNGEQMDQAMVDLLNKAANDFLNFSISFGGTISGLENDIVDAVSGLFNRAKIWTWPRDPIILDLDGDGLETVGLASSNAYFDFDGDGVLSKTGWVGKDDALLVWDRNSSGSIDSGELITLADAGIGIVSLNLANQLKNQTLANGCGRVAAQQRGTHRRTH